MKQMSIATLRALLKKASKGDDTADKRLRNYNAQLAKISNARLERLEKHNMDYYAYDRAVTFTDTAYGGNRFRIDYISLENPKQVYNSILEQHVFLDSKTSTIRGQKQIIAERLESFRDMGLAIPHNKRAERAFIQFLNDTDTFDFLKKAFNSSQLFGYIADMLAPRNTRTKRLIQLQQAVDAAIDASNSRNVRVAQPLDELFAELGVDILSEPKTKIKRKN